MVRGSGRATVLLLALCCPGLAQAEDPTFAWNAPRSLPSLVTRWSHDLRAETWLLDDGILYANGRGRLTALAAETGAVLWDTSYGPPDPPAAPSDEHRYGPVLVGSALAVSWNDQLFLIDRTTGRVRNTVTFAEGVDRLVGPPLVIELGRRDPGTPPALVRIDPDDGRIVARRAFHKHLFSDLTVFGGNVLAIVVDRDNIELGHLVGLDPGTLEDRWRRDLRAGSFAVEAVAGNIYLAQFLYAGEGSESRERIDPQTGALGPTLPERAAEPPGVHRPMWGSRWTSWEVEVFSAESKPSVMRRNMLDDGHVVWSATLPCGPSAWTHDGKELFVRCGMGMGRGVLVTLDWATGALRRVAYGVRWPAGFPGQTKIERFGDLLLLNSDTSLLAVSAHEQGPPEQQAPIGDALEQILAAVGPPLDHGREGHIRDVVGDLKTLGSEALPLLTARVPGLSGDALIAAVSVLGECHYRPAAPAIAALLMRPPLEWLLEAHVLDALHALAGASEVEPLVSVLRDPSRMGYIRGSAFTLLATIGTPRALASLDAFLARPRPRPSRWLVPPSPDREAIHPRLDAPKGGGALILFRDHALGNSDLWLAAQDAQGRSLRPALFLGASPWVKTLTARLEGSILHVQEHTPDAVSFDLVEAARDSDQDGLTDAIESRLGTDPRKRDSDGDGVADAEDLNPLTRPHPPKGDEQEAVAALFEQYFHFRKCAPRPQLVVSAFDLEWHGCAWPTISVPPGDPRLERRDFIAVRPIAQSTHHQQPSADLLPQEREYELEQGSTGERIVMRKIGRRWYMTSSIGAWIR